MALACESSNASSHDSFECQVLAIRTRRAIGPLDTWVPIPFAESRVYTGENLDTKWRIGAKCGRTREC